jgi:tripartite-type tricarboxylate transporter receptor subunit TctC
MLHETLYESLLAASFVATTLVIATASGESAAAYPERPIRWIVPAAAGGGADASARVIAIELGRILNQQVVIDNRPGGSGIIGIDIVANAPPNGYTVGAGNITNIAMNRAVIAKLPYDAERDLRAVVQTHFQSNVLAITPALSVKSVQELIDYARTNPGKLSYASSGTGSSLHFAGELFNLIARTQIVHIPYKSVPVALTDLFANRIQLIFDNTSSIAPHVKSGKVRALGVTSSKRSAVFPELPTIAEAGVKDYDLVVWSGVIVPAATPIAIVEQLNTAVNRALQTREVREKLAQLGLEIVGGRAQDFAQLISRESRKWAEVAKRADIRPE